MRLIVGVDLGGTSIVVGTMAEDGSALWGEVSEPTPVALGPDAVIGRMVAMVGESLARTRQALGTDRLDIAGVGVGAPGPLDTDRGIVIVAPNLGWRDLPLRDRIADGTGLTATLDNDANCATLGEWWQGAARGGRVVIGLTIGTGIGGGIVLDGQIFHGASDVAAEFGHMTVDVTGRRCKCGNYGCLEAYASGPAIAARAVEDLEAGTPSAIPTYVDGDLTKVTAQTVYQAAHDGDPFALDVVRETARFLGAGIANLVNVLNPDVVVVTGGVTKAGDRLFGPLRIDVARRAFKPAVDACRIVPGTLPGTAGVVGAVAAFKVQHWGAV
ncbi:MAG: ROK family protein [Gemmatimonadota bacterium]|nr:ROK family protein [Gemmatimonadota bacterium]